MRLSSTGLASCCLNCPASMLLVSWFSAAILTLAPLQVPDQDPVHITEVSGSVQQHCTEHVGDRRRLLGALAPHHK